MSSHTICIRKTSVFYSIYLKFLLKALLLSVVDLHTSVSVSNEQKICLTNFPDKIVFAESIEMSRVLAFISAVNHQLSSVKSCTASNFFHKLMLIVYQFIHHQQLHLIFQWNKLSICKLLFQRIISLNCSQSSNNVLSLPTKFSYKFDLNFCFNFERIQIL